MASTGPQDIVDAAAEAVLARFDWNANGFSPHPFDPEPEALAFLLALGLRTGKPYALRAMLRSLSSLSGSPAHDHVDGGFFQSAGGSKGRPQDTTKPLTLNARIVHVIGLAAGWRPDADLRRLALETAGHIDRAFSVPGSHLWANQLKADEEYYGKMAHRRALHGAPTWEGDPSIIASATVVSAFAVAGTALAEPKLVARARIAFDQLKELEQMGGNDFVIRGSQQGTGTALATAALDLYNATGDPGLVEAAGRLEDWSSSDAWAPDVMPSPTSDNDVASVGRAAIAGLRIAQLIGRPDFAATTELVLRPPPAYVARAGVHAAPFGLAALAAEGGVIEVAWGGGRLETPRGAVVRGAIALASALGPTIVRREANDSGHPAFIVGGKSSGPIADASEIKSKMAALVPLHETI